ncbi:MAG: hypothetical protein OEZ06_13165 [Myxococcales bacterium]|nr:hypothetical protein [Myxococcales bacterium]
MLERARRLLPRFALLPLCVVLGSCIGPGLEPPDNDDGSAFGMTGPSRGDGAADQGTAPGGTNTGGSAPTTNTPSPSQPSGSGGSSSGPSDDPASLSPPPANSDDDAGVDDEAVAPGLALFEGVWAVEQPFHGSYEATVYEFVADGSLLEHETVTSGDLSLDFVTGTVADATGSISCRFGSRWRADVPRTALIEGVCSDGLEREISLDFPFGLEAFGLIPVISVAGDTGWVHPGWPWSFRKCGQRAGCVLSP